MVSLGVKTNYDKLKETINKISRKKLIAIIITLALVGGFIFTGPNTFADGFIVSIELGGGSSMQSTIMYVDDFGTAYYILFEGFGNYTYDVSHSTDSKFQAGDKQFFYNSTMQYSTRINEIIKIINQTKFYKHDWVYWDITKSNGYSINDIRIVQLNATCLHNLTHTIKNSGFIISRHNYNRYFGPGGMELEMTIPRYHKTIKAIGSAGPKGVEDIDSFVGHIFYSNYPYNGP
jgi:hypothetical protein